MFEEFYLIYNSPRANNKKRIPIFRSFIYNIENLLNYLQITHQFQSLIYLNLVYLKIIKLNSLYHYIQPVNFYAEFRLIYEIQYISELT